MAGVSLFLTQDGFTSSDPPIGATGALLQRGNSCKNLLLAKKKPK